MLRFFRGHRGLTLTQAAHTVGLSASALSLIETGKREAKLSVLTGLAEAYHVRVEDLFSTRAPSQRAALEIELEQAQRAPEFAALGVPSVRISPGLSTEALAALVGLHRALSEVRRERAATPESARQANTLLRSRMKAQDNYFGEIEVLAGDLLRHTEYQGGPVRNRLVDDIARRLGYSIVPAADLPFSTRTVTDRKHRRIFVPEVVSTKNELRSLTLQALGHVALGHDVPRDYGEFLEQRIEVNYFTAAIKVPEREAAALLIDAKARRELAIEDLAEEFEVSFETAAHRFTNLSTRHLEIPVHFMRVSREGIIHKAYSNDGVNFPADATGSVEGQRVCRYWTVREAFNQPWGSAYSQYTDTGAGTFWCTATIDETPDGPFSVSIGVPNAQVRWMRDRVTEHRAVSRCPDPRCCARPGEEVERRWRDAVFPDARLTPGLLSALPPGRFPGVDDVEVMEFLERRGP
ncbi:helix-turn-helix domain-containing protein [Micrococcales bacterium 31B]|nr:helix-turn-helix domain-containing protein [Micrococcales bacterium 31B]